jgi:polyisoprenoid-binding protein YceI
LNRVVQSLQTFITRPASLVAPLSLASLGIASIVTPVAAQDDAATPTAGVLASPAIEINCNTEGDDMSDVVAKIASIYSINSEESEARYRVQEELRGIGDTEAVGATDAFIGQILFDENGMPLECSRFDVDLRTLTSDEARRDNYLYTNTLETEQYPLATFVLTSVEGLDAALVDGEETTFNLIGNLTVHGVTKLVSWDATATKNGEALTGSATMTFEMPEFGIEPPKAGPVISLDETVVLEIDFTAESAA